jgi:hypothetical protein
MALDMTSTAFISTTISTLIRTAVSSFRTALHTTLTYQQVVRYLATIGGATTLIE